MVETYFLSKSDALPEEISRRLAERLCSTDPIEMISASLTVMEGAFEEKAWATDELAKPLLGC